MKKSLPPVFARVRAALMRRGRSPQDADDFVQEAWARLAVYERHHAVDTPEAFMMSTALNLSIDAHRAKMNHGEEVLLDEVIVVDESPSVEAVVLGRERVIRLSECLGRLNERTRDIFLAHRVDGLTYREIGEQHGLSTTTVEKHVARATLQLTTWMEGW
jgi:RNA polymerase sigma factor (sigma-70 family)